MKSKAGNTRGSTCYDCGQVSLGDLAGTVGGIINV